MDPTARRLLDEIQAAQLSPDGRAQLARALRRPAGHPSSTAKWDSPLEFLSDLCEWTASLPTEDLPPREQDAARTFGCTRRTIGRWLAKAGVPGWDGFLRFWALVTRDE